MSAELVAALGASAVMGFAGAGILRTRRRTDREPTASDAYRTRSCWRLLSTDEEVRSATERALYFERQEAHVASERVHRYERSLEKMEAKRADAESREPPLRALVSGPHGPASPPEAA